MTKVLIVEDDEIIGEELTEVFVQWGFDATAVLTVESFWSKIEEFQPQIIVVDLTLPDGSGADIIRDIRAKSDIGIIVISGRSDEIERVACIEMGADDYLVKPFDPEELRSRVRAGERILALQNALAARVEELGDALAHVRTLQGLLPICMHCKRIRDESDSWQRIERYISEHTEASFTHSLCEPCRDRHYPRDKSGVPA